MRFEDAYEGWTSTHLTQIDAARLPGGCPRTVRRTIHRVETFANALYPQA